MGLSCFGFNVQFIALAFERSEACDVFLSVGTSGAVYPAADLPYRALEAGATVVEINPVPTPLAQQCDYVLAGSAATILPNLLEALSP